MPKNSSNNTALVSYHQMPDGAQRGVIVDKVAQPYHIIIDKRGAWQIQQYGAGDEPRTLASGRAHNVTTAKRKAHRHALANIDELKTPDIITTTATPVTAPPVHHNSTTRSSSAWRTVKIYIALSLFCFAALLFGRWMLLYRPSWFVRVMFWGGSSFVLAHRLITFIDDSSKRLDRLRRAPAAAHQPMKMPRGKR